MLLNSTKEFIRESENCLDPQFWHACAGGMARMPSVNSKVYYFPQGHAEHAQGNADFGSSRLSALILCRVSSIKFMADSETDEVFAKIRLVPIGTHELEYDGIEDELALDVNGTEMQEKPTSFAKTLTQSDANNGGGFSVPRYCAETIFPRLDYTADPPVQTVQAKDVHGESWKFRHIYRGTPRRHLLTTGWSTFVNQKKLVAGDSIVFLRAENGDICVGIRRVKRGFGGVSQSSSGWNPSTGNSGSNYGTFSAFLREEESKLMRTNGNGNNPNLGGNTRGRAKVRPESVLEAATLAASGQAFEVVYYPRASTPEFCVKAASVRAAMRIHWCSGMRFKMPFETEDSSRISWFMGTISSIQVTDPIRWPNSPWRSLQVTWDEPDLLQNVKCVNPWLVELVSNMPINMTPFSPPRKKIRIFHRDFPLDGQIPTPVFSGNLLGPSSSPLCCLPDSTSAGIQGARHAHFGVSLSDLHLHKLQEGLLQAGFHRFEHPTPPTRISTGLIMGNPTVHDSVSCLLTVGTDSSQKANKPCNGKTPVFLLFGQPILTEQQISMTSSGSSSSDGGTDKTANGSDGSGYAVQQYGAMDNASCEGFLWHKACGMSELGLETGHCKVFIESEDVGRTLDLSVLSSYEELYERLADMFGIAKSGVLSHVLYRDAYGVIKHTGEQPFGEFIKTARKLTIQADSSSNGR